jgi:hypothetical protein
MSPGMESPPGASDVGPWYLAMKSGCSGNYREKSSISRQFYFSSNILFGTLLCRGTECCEVEVHAYNTHKRSALDW